MATPPDADQDVNPAPAPALPPEPVAAKSFLASKTFWIALLALVVAPVLKKLGLEFTDAQQQEAAENIVRVMGFGGIVWARAKAGGPLHFGTSAAATVISIASLVSLTGCNALRQAVRDGTVRPAISWTTGEETFTATLDGKRVRLHGGVNLGGGEVGADVALPLPRHRRNSGGLAK